MKKRGLFALFLMLSLLLTGCGQSGDDTVDNSDAAGSGIALSDMFTDRDFEIGYDESESVAIRLNGDTASCDSNAVEISGSTVTITDEGTYILSGALDDGMVIVNAEKTDKLQIVLDNVSIHSESSAALYILQADKVFLTMATDSVNTLSNGGTFTAIDENNIDAVIFSREDLTLNGNGSMTIESPAGHGIVSKDDLVLTSGTYEITASSHGLSGKDSVRIAAGSFTIASGKDGVHAENTDDASSGFLYIAGGTYQIEAEGDGLSAESTLQIEDGSFTIQTGGGSANAVTTQSNDMRGGFFGPEMESSTSSEDTVSTKGVKASGDLTLNGGTFSIDSMDDAFHSNANLTVNGGSYEIATGDDGFHADEQMVIHTGDINITESYEGIEGLSVEISGGNISLVASDDGINAAGGNDQSGMNGPWGVDHFSAGSDDCFIHISGGTLYIQASGDGIDSNGSLTISGGETCVSGPTNGADGALDCESEATITGGIFVAVGSSQMAQNFGSASTQGAIMVSVGSQQAGSVIALADSAGQTLLSWTADKAFDSVLMSCPEIVQGSTYTLTVDGSSTEITMDSLLYSAGGGIGGMHAMGGKGGMMEEPGIMGDKGDLGDMKEPGIMGGKGDLGDRP